MVARTNSDNKHNIDENQESDDRNYEATASWEVCDWMCYENDQQHKTANNGKSGQNEMDAVPGRTGGRLPSSCRDAFRPDLQICTSAKAVTCAKKTAPNSSGNIEGCIK